MGETPMPPKAAESLEKPARPGWPFDLLMRQHQARERAREEAASANFIPDVYNGLLVA